MEEPELTAREAFTVAGLKYRGANEKGEISELWSAFGKRSERFASIAASGDAYGVSFNFDDETNAFDYVAGVEVRPDAEIPEDMHTVDVPEQTYAIFTCTLDELGETIDGIYQEWLPESQYARVASPEFEHYDPEFDASDANSTLELYLPVTETQPYG